MTDGHHLKLENLRDALAAREAYPELTDDFEEGVEWLEDAARVTVDAAVAAKLIDAEPGETYKKFIASAQEA